jgi:predicted Zn finger-like uncharacterized protein
MQTSCPECGTTFRVSQEQLGLRRGLVRCGHCNAVFNAYDTLLPELEEVPAAPPPELRAAMPGAEETTAAATPPADASADVQSSYAEAGISVTSPTVSLSEREASVAELPAATEVEAARDETPRPPEPDTAEETAEAILLSDLPNRLAQRRARLPRWQWLLYLVVIACLGLTLVGQVAYFLRGELAADLPGSRPLLNALCRPMGCVVPLPQKLTRKAIVSSSLEHDSEQKSRVRLSFLLANRTRQTQAWPHVILTLSDVRESPIAQKAFAPEFYLPQGISVRAGFPNESEQEARVDLDIGNLAASSYVLSIAYP